MKKLLCLLTLLLINPIKAHDFSFADKVVIYSVFGIIGAGFSAIPAFCGYRLGKACWYGVRKAEQIELDDWARWSLKIRKDACKEEASRVNPDANYLSVAAKDYAKWEEEIEKRQNNLNEKTDSELWSEYINPFCKYSSYLALYIFCCYSALKR